MTLPESKSNSEPQYVRESEASRLTGLSPAWLRRARWAGNGPTFVKLASQVLYDKRDLFSWLEERKVGSTSERQQIKQ